jgi:NAD(P)-dependent dehydrogenase (short-subunit alcohol dehydrogenase family)
MQSLGGKNAVITGAGSGIGRAIALALAESGVRIVVADIHEESARTVAEEVRRMGVETLPVRCDVSDQKAVQALADASYKTFGRIDILCNNAGISWRPFRSVLDATLEDWRFILGINLWGVLHGLDAFLPRMRAQVGEKHIVNTASLAALLPHEGHAPYSSSKAAVAALSEVMAAELAPHGFGVTTLMAGPIKTNLADNVARIWGDRGYADQREFEPVETPTMIRLRPLTLPSADPVGVMVRNAILNNQRLIHTSHLPDEMVAERVNALFGQETIGRT